MTAVVLRSMDPALEEAAAISGAKPWQAICAASPCARCWPALLAAGIYVAMIGFAAFDVPAILGLTRPHLHLLDLCLLGADAVRRRAAIWQRRDAQRHHGRARRRRCPGDRQAQKQAPKYAVVTGKAYRPRIAALGKYRGLAIAFVALYFIVAQLMPLLMLAWASLLPYLQTPSAAALANRSRCGISSICRENCCGAPAPTPRS